MTAFNVVRFRVKPGREQDFIDAHKDMASEPPIGARRFALIRTGDNSFCIVGEWEGMDSIVEARPMMIGRLEALREMLEDLGADLGVTDPVSGEAVVVMSAPEPPPPAKKARRAPVPKRKPASKARATSARQGKPAAKKKPAARKVAKKPARKKAAKRGRK